MIYPMFTMILLTSVVAIYLFRLRVAAVKKGEVSLGSFRLNNSADTPPKLLQAMRNYSNLFEVPVLFYVAGAVTMALHVYSPALILLGWLFVASRIAHSWIHLTNNNVIRRLQAFMVGNVCVLLMWILLVVKYSAQHAS